MFLIIALTRIAIFVFISFNSSIISLQVYHYIYIYIYIYILLKNELQYYKLIYLYILKRQTLPLMRDCTCGLNKLFLKKKYMMRRKTVT